MPLMKGRFLGGAGEVGRLGMYLDTGGTKLLFEYGLSPKKPPQYPDHSPEVDLLLLTHAHLDHSGMIPWVVSRFSTPVYATEATSVVSTILLNDSLKIAQYEGYPEPYSKYDIRSTERLYEDIIFGQNIDLDDIVIIPHDAGHIPGSTMFQVKGQMTDILFTGDINTQDTKLIKGADPVGTDILVMESTYAGREHPDRRELTFEFLDRVEDIIASGGQVIVPAFAVGRTQELLMVLRNQGYDVWVDGMGREITRRYIDLPQFVRDIRNLDEGFKDAKIVRRSMDRKKVLKADVIVTTSGMLDGGPVQEYMQRLNNPANGLFLTGYQVENTNGRKLLDTGHVEVQGKDVKMEMQVEQFDFSAHAGHTELVDFAKGCSPETIVLMHGDNREALAEDLSEFELLMPVMGEEFEI